jgi:hypothetical protein
MELKLSFTDCTGTDIPYFHPWQDANTRHEYVDLRENPEKIDELPEMRQSSEFRQMILAINAPVTLFRTFGCEFKCEPDESLLEVAKQRLVIDRSESLSPHLVISYIHVGFADLPRCKSADDFYVVCGRLGQHLTDNNEEFWKYGQKILKFDLTLSIQSLRFNHEPFGRVLRIECKIGGRWEAEARTEWNRLMSLITAFLVSETLQ